MTWRRAVAAACAAGCASPAAVPALPSAAAFDPPPFRVVVMRDAIPCDHVALRADARVVDACGLEFDARTGDFVRRVDDALAGLVATVRCSTI